MLKGDVCFNLVQDKSQSAEIWEKLNFGNKDQNVKFRKLMGIKVKSYECINKLIINCRISGISLLIKVLSKLTCSYVV